MKKIVFQTRKENNMFNITIYGNTLAVSVGTGDDERVHIFKARPNAFRYVLHSIIRMLAARRGM